MAGIFSLLKTWNENETLTSQDLNNAFLNQKTNATAAATEGYSTVNNVPNLARIQADIDPAPSGDPLASEGNQTVAGEIQRIRYQIKKILGSDYWYDAPASSLTDQISAPFFVSSCDTFNSWVASGGLAGPFRVESSTGAGYVNITNDEFKFGSGCVNVLNDTNSSTFSAPAIPLGKLTNKKLSFAFWAKDFFANANVFSTTILPLDISITSDLKVQLIVKSMSADTSSTKVSYTITGDDAIVATQWNHIAVALDFSGDAGSHKIALYVNGVLQTGSTSSATFYALTNVPIQGAFGLRFSRFYDFPVVAAFSSTTVTGFSLTGSAPSLSNGVLNYGAGSSYYGASANVTQVDMAFRLDYLGSSASSQADYTTYPNILKIRNAGDYELLVYAGPNELVFVSASVVVGQVLIDPFVWHNLRVTNSGSSSFEIYLDGRPVFFPSGLVGFTLSASTNGSGGVVQFGVINSGVLSGLSVNIAWLAYDTAAVPATGIIPNSALSDGYVDEVVSVDSYFTENSSLLGALQNGTVSGKFGNIQSSDPRVSTSQSLIDTDPTQTGGTSIMRSTGLYSLPFVAKPGKRYRVSCKGTVSLSSAAGDILAGLTLCRGGYPYTNQDFPRSANYQQQSGEPFQIIYAATTGQEYPIDLEGIFIAPVVGEDGFGGSTIGLFPSVVSLLVGPAVGTSTTTVSKNVYWSITEIDY